ncbi:MAG TPA: hypothetical protein VGO68_07960 [Pyrinomonadaceae bacterium]|jgi:hypothetical protein|nr:hypothetical protein [Pyrinomonadaceae bacterium]
MATSTSSIQGMHATSGVGFFDKLNSTWHKRTLQVFMAIVLLHWAEHLTQATQIYVLGWPRPKAGGFMGLFFPWLVSSEVLHYGYALVMLVFLWILRPGFTGTSRKWWTVALVIQFWHHIEHLLLQGQALLHHNLIGSPVPVSFLQMVFPKSRVEIHLFYNAIVFIPMVIGMYYHMFPPPGEEAAKCNCQVREKSPRTVAA